MSANASVHLLKCFSLLGQSSSWWQIKAFQNSNLKLAFFSSVTNTVHCFLQDSHCVSLRKHLPHTQKMQSSSNALRAPLSPWGYAARNLCASGACPLAGPAHKAVSLDRVSKPTLQKGFDTHHEHL